MKDRDYFVSEISQLLSEYHKNELCSRSLNLLLKLSESLLIINEEKKELPIDFSNLSLIRVGKRVSIVYDGKFYYLLNNLKYTLFCRQLSKEGVESYFKDLESDQEVL